MNINNSDSSKKIPKRRWRKANLIVVIVLFFIAFFAISALINFIHNQRLDLVRATEGSYTMEIDCEVVVVRNESIVYAPASGRFDNSVGEGAKVKVGTLIGQMSIVPEGMTESTTVKVSAEKGGIIYFDLDGWEESLKEADLISTDWAAVFTQMRDEPQTVSATADTLNNTASGRKIARIVDNLADVNLCIHVQEDISDYLENDNLHLQFIGMEKDTIIKANLSNIDEINTSEQYLHAKLESIEPYFYTGRYSAAKIIGKTICGIKIPFSAITVNEQGLSGVFISEKNKMVFKEVSVLYSEDDFVIVSGLKATDMVAANPKYTNSGQKVN